jgi:hypothetical protein
MRIRKQQGSLLEHLDAAWRVSGKEDGGAFHCHNRSGGSLVTFDNR